MKIIGNGKELTLSTTDKNGVDCAEDFISATEVAAIIRDCAWVRDTTLAALELLSDQAEKEANANQAADAVRINIKSAREAAGISQTELAERIGTTRQQIGKYEGGAQDMSVARLFQIAAALGVAPEILVKN